MSDLGHTLLRLARNAIAERLDVAPIAGDEDLPELHAPGASFVTLTQQGRLRGCIGTLEAYRPLALDVAENARAAAFRDPRFAPLSAAEFAQTRVEVSLLSPPQAWPVQDEDDACARLQPGIDGLILQAGARRATFLPQVWESLPDPRAFLQQLKQKAGLPADYWGGDIALQRYQVQKWKA